MNLPIVAGASKKTPFAEKVEQFIYPLSSAFSPLNGGGRTFQSGMFFSGYSGSSSGEPYTLGEAVLLLKDQSGKPFNKALQEAGVCAVDAEDVLGYAYNTTQSGTKQGILNTNTLQSPHCGKGKSTKYNFSATIANGTIGRLLRLPTNGYAPSDTSRVPTLDLIQRKENVGYAFPDTPYFYNDADHILYYVSARNGANITVCRWHYAGGATLDNTVYPDLVLPGHPYGTAGSVEVIWAGKQADGSTKLVLCGNPSASAGLAVARVSTIGAVMWTVPNPTTAGNGRYPRNYLTMSGDDASQGYPIFLPTADGSKIVITNGAVLNAAGTGTSTATGWFVVETDTLTSIARNVKASAQRSTSSSNMTALAHVFGGGGTSVCTNCLGGVIDGLIESGVNYPVAGFDPMELFETSTAAKTWMANYIAPIVAAGSRLPNYLNGATTTSAVLTPSRLWHHETRADGKSYLVSLDGIMVGSPIIEAAITSVRPLNHPLEALDDKYRFSVYDVYDPPEPIEKTSTIELDVDWQTTIDLPWKSA